MYKYLSWKYPEAIHYGRLKITGASLSKSKIVQGVREGLFNGWDDPRLATFAALRRRGIAAEAIRRMIIDVGPKTSDVILSWENLYAYNRKILDPAADRYFFVPNPLELRVKQIPKTLEARLKLHPDHPERGFREYIIEPEGDDRTATFWVSKADIEAQAGRVLRLMEMFNIRVKTVTAYSGEATFISESYEEAKKTGAQLIHWVPAGKDMPCEVVMPDATVTTGIAEAYCKKLEPNMIVQFERFGFVRIDDVCEKLRAYYSQK
jgi:glutamyl-tRNA synthetase